jgi:hypothetical protein
MNFNPSSAIKKNAYFSKQRLYASLLIDGAGILLFRTITMIHQVSLDVLVW